MLTGVLLLLRSIVLICGGSRAVALENLALRQQVAVLRRTLKRPRLRARDRDMVPEEAVEARIPCVTSCQINAYR